MVPDRNTETPASESVNPYAEANVRSNSKITPASLEIPAWIAVVCCAASLALWFVALIVSLPYGNPNAPPLTNILGFVGMFLVCPALGLAGAVSMIRRTRYKLSLIGALCMLVPVLGPCFGLTFPIGIWILVVLFRAPIRDSFAPSTEPVPDSYGNAEDALAAASRFNTYGDWDTAIEFYRSIAARWPEHANYAESCIDEVTKKKTAATRS
jgi:hypothetical protein